MDLDRSWIPGAEIHARLAAVRPPISPDQLERWRGWGLLPGPRQKGLGHSKGSVALYPARTVEQAIETAKLFKRFRHHQRVGWELWLSGYEVYDCYWRPLLEKRHAVVRKALRLLSRRLTRAEEDDDFADKMFGEPLPRTLLPRPLLGASRNMPAEEVSEAIWRLTRAATGQLHDSPDIDDGDGHEHDPAFKLLGLRQSERDAALGARFDFRAGLMSALHAIGAAPPLPPPGQFFRGASLARLLAARDDVRNGFGAIAAFHEAMTWIYGRYAFGLKLAAWIATLAPPETIAAIIVMWTQVRESSAGDFLTSSEIAEMRRNAELALENVRQLRAVVEWDESLKPIVTPKRLKRALKARSDFEKFLKEVENRPAV